MVAIRKDERRIRLFKILEYLAKQDPETLVPVDELKEKLNLEVTKAQLYEDLNELTRMGYILKEYGGVRKVGGYGFDPDKLFQNTPYGRRLNVLPEVKQKIAEKIVYDGRVSGKRIFITSGTSCKAFFDVLRGLPSDRADLFPNHIVTNHIPGFLAILRETHLPVTLIGGELKRDAAATGGDGTERLGIYTAMLSVSGINADEGFFCDDGLEELRSSVIRQAEELIILTDHSKLARLPGGLEIDIDPDELEGIWKKTWLYVDLWKEAFPNPPEGDPWGTIIRNFEKINKEKGDEGAKEAEERIDKFAEGHGPEHGVYLEELKKFARKLPRGRLRIIEV